MTKETYDPLDFDPRLPIPEIIGQLALMPGPARYDDLDSWTQLEIQSIDSTHHIQMGIEIVHIDPHEKALFVEGKRIYDFWGVDFKLAMKLSERPGEVINRLDIGIFSSDEHTMFVIGLLRRALGVTLGDPDTGLIRTVGIGKIKLVTDLKESFAWVDQAGRYKSSQGEMLKLDTETDELFIEESLDHGLNERAESLLKLLLRHPGKTVSKDQIAEHLGSWSENRYITAARVSKAIGRLRGSLGRRYAFLIETVFGEGYRIRVDEDNELLSTAR